MIYRNQAMKLEDLVEAIMRGDLLGARQWVSDTRRAGIDWPTVARPEGLSARALAVGAGMAELLAERARTAPPAWVSDVAVQGEPMVLDPGLEKMPRSFAYAKKFGPEPLRKRNLIALPDFLDVA
jgi:hypothetical protein